VSSKPKAVVSDAVAIARVKHHTYCLLIDRIFLTVRTAIKAGGAAFALWEGHETIKSLAQGTVNWNAVLTAMASGRLPTGIMLCVTVLSLAVAGSQIYLRRRHAKDKDAYIKQLEQKVDPNRSSSRLPAGGKTRREDKE
jgi:hypothetical protein